MKDANIQVKINADELEDLLSNTSCLVVKWSGEMNRYERYEAIKKRNKTQFRTDNCILYIIMFVAIIGLFF